MTLNQGKTEQAIALLIRFNCITEANTLRVAYQQVGRIELHLYDDSSRTIYQAFQQVGIVHAYHTKKGYLFFLRS